MINQLEMFQSKEMHIDCSANTNEVMGREICAFVTDPSLKTDVESRRSAYLYFITVGDTNKL